MFRSDVQYFFTKFNEIKNEKESKAELENKNSEILLLKEEIDQLKNSHHETAINCHNYSNMS